MKRLSLAFAVAAAAFAVAPAFADAPPGVGLLGPGYHATSCTGALDYSGDDVVLVPGAGNSFWVAGYHLVIQEVTIVWDDSPLAPVTYTFGAKQGKAGQTVVCTGHFEELGGYTVTSTDVLVP